MTVELSRDKIDVEKEAKKLAKEAKKAEKAQKKAESKAKKTAEKETGDAYMKSVNDLNAAADTLYDEYDAQIKARGKNFSEWPEELREKFAFMISLEDEDTVEVFEQRDFVFDPSKGFKPTVNPEPEVVKPFDFAENLAKAEKPKKDPQMTDAEFMALELAFGKYFVNQVYRYEKYNGIYKLSILRTGGVEETYIIDNGTVLGGKDFAILANMENDTTFVFADDPEVPEILRSKFYTITSDCAKRNQDRMFESGIIYRYIDFSNTTWLNDDDIDKKALEAGLLGVIRVTSNNGESPRMRFTKFESAKSFELVSDSFVKSPLSDIDATTSLVVPGLVVKVKDNNVEVYNNQILAGQYTISVK